MIPPIQKIKTTSSTSSKTGITGPSTPQLSTTLTVNGQHDLANILNNNHFVPYCYKTLTETYKFKCPLIKFVNVLEYMCDNVAASKLKPYLPEKDLLAHMKRIELNKSKRERNVNKTPFTLEKIATFIERELDYKIRKGQASSFKHLQSNKVPILCQFYG